MLLLQTFVNGIRNCNAKNRDCIITNVMHTFLIYLSIYFCLTCFGLSFNPSSEAGAQLYVRQK
jgi:hypothetical protein